MLRPGTGALRSSFLEVQGGFEFGGELGHGGGDLGGLFDESGHHALGHLGFVADEFRCGHDEGKMVVDVMSQGGKLLVQFLDLLDINRTFDRLTA